jgi:hypothetical protein
MIPVRDIDKITCRQTQSATPRPHDPLPRNELVRLIINSFLRNTNSRQISQAIDPLALFSPEEDSWV